MWGKALKLILAYVFATPARSLARQRIRLRCAIGEKMRCAPGNFFVSASPAASTPDVTPAIFAALRSAVCSFSLVEPAPAFDPTV